MSSDVVESARRHRVNRRRRDYVWMRRLLRVQKRALGTQFRLVIQARRERIGFRATADS